MLVRSFTVDVLKVVAAQFIVWHHFSAYGPMALTMQSAWPLWLDTFYEGTRLAVQVFLVVAGYLAGQSIRQPSEWHPLIAIVKRYLRLAPFFVLALALITVTVSLLRHTIHDDWLPSPAHAWQFLAHALLVQDLLGFEALSSGAWYVAIDFQLYAVLMVLCHFLNSGSPHRLTLGVATLCIGSMWFFNRHQALDIWAFYFFYAYGLGVLAAWAKRSRFDAAVFGVTALLAWGALLVEFRVRLCVALVTAIWLVIKPKGMVHWSPMKRIVHRLSNSAYVLFLTHFGVIVLCSSLWNVFNFQHPYTALGVSVLAWLACVGVGLFLHERVEVPLHHWVAQKTAPWLLRLACSLRSV